MQARAHLQRGLPGLHTQKHPEIDMQLPPLTWHIRGGLILRGLCCSRLGAVAFFATL